MNENAGKQKSEASAEKPKPAVSKKPVQAKQGRSLMFFAFLFSLIAMLGSAWLGYQLFNVKNATQDQFSQLQKNFRALDEHPSLIEVKQRVLDQDSKIDHSIEEQLAKIEALRQAFTASQRIVNRDQQGWILAEIEYLLRLAIIRLRLTLDVRGATEALKIADERLADLADPALLEVRELLVGEISALKFMAAPDIEGAALKLIGLSNQLHLLPQAKRPSIENLEQASETSYEKKTDYISQILNALGIRRSDAPIATAALQAELFYVEQLILLELDGAKRAVLELNNARLEHHLSKARSLLEENYDRENEQVIRMRAELINLQESRLIPEIPDITGSLQKLQELQLKYHPQPLIRQVQNEK